MTSNPSNPLILCERESVGAVCLMTSSLFVLIALVIILDIFIYINELHQTNGLKRIKGFEGLEVFNRLWALTLNPLNPLILCVRERYADERGCT